MPEKTQQAVDWALQQTWVRASDGKEIDVTKNEPIALTTKVREYFNENNIEYSTFSFSELIPYLTNE